ncbi:hypothetical protein [Serratia sp. Se-RSBMAAmG]|uniref:hypothetical protein n=1 Tax=Serratia sp. Se-RSBMAAmG TaxID=3043305 RepID=UPI0024AF8A43|nr:hypothetical protein [Serratia sp. Se-RSBMAAmG]MDI6976532.1 hypothetical protein [Serratia sp. Se-RSBMAAmG]
MSFTGTKGRWYLDEGWMDGHISLSSDDHSAFAQILVEMEDTTSERQRKEFEANAKVMVIAPEMYALVEAMKADQKVYDVLKVLNPGLVEQAEKILSHMESEMVLR